MWLQQKKQKALLCISRKGKKILMVPILLFCELANRIVLSLCLCSAEKFFCLLEVGFAVSSSFGISRSDCGVTLKWGSDSCWYHSQWSWMCSSKDLECGVFGRRLEWCPITCFLGTAAAAVRSAWLRLLGWVVTWWANSGCVWNSLAKPQWFSALENTPLNELSFRCHPQIKWFQDNTTVTLKVQILRAADSKCEFSKEKVVFR